MRRIMFLSLAAMLMAPTAFAQSSNELNDRLGRLERDLNYLQRQVYSTKTGAPSDPNAMPVAGGEGTAQLQVRLTAIEEQMRQLRGQIEQANYATQANATAINKLEEDVNYRLQTIEQAQSAAAVAATTAATAPTETMAPVEAKVSETPASYKPSPSAADETSVTGGDFPNSNAHYNHAFKLLNAKKYSEAATSFDEFVRTYPKDPLTSNAYYWLGESYYARGDYTRAAEGFRKGFETSPKGQKAPDNLLKLAMSLEKIKRTNEACIVLKTVITKYSDSAPRTAQRADEERTRMACK
jgi:tol-pal system protein YbgF